MTRFPKILISLLAASLLAPTAMFAEDHGSKKNHGDEKISEDALKADSQSSMHVIIQYKSQPGWLQNLLLEVVKGNVLKHFNALDAVVAEVPGYSLKMLARDPNVSYISLDRKVGSRQFSSASAEYTTEPINAPAVWAQGFDGSGVGVAVIDSGITVVDDLQVGKGLVGNILTSALQVVKGGSKVVYNQSFLPSSQTRSSNYTDAYGHGTHVAGLIAGTGSDSTGNKYFRTFSGVAPNASLINLRVLDANGQGTDSSVIEAIDAAIRLKDTYNIRVINLSLGRPIWESYTVDPLCQAVEKAWKAGIVVVVAAGNDGRDQALNPEGYGTIEAPGNDPYVITVGAMRTMATAGMQDDLLASYSSKGPSFIDHIVKPDVVAPRQPGQQP